MATLVSLYGKTTKSHLSLFGRTRKENKKIQWAMTRKPSSYFRCCQKKSAISTQQIFLYVAIVPYHSGWRLEDHGLVCPIPNFQSSRTEYKRTSQFYICDGRIHYILGSSGPLLCWRGVVVSAGCWPLVLTLRRIVCIHSRDLSYSLRRRMALCPALFISSTPPITNSNFFFARRTRLKDEVYEVIDYRSHYLYRLWSWNRREKW